MENKKHMEKKYIAVPLIAAVLFALLFAFSYDKWQISNSDATSWKEQFYSKANDYDKLAKDLEDHEGQIHNLSAAYTNLESQLGDFQRQIDSLNSQNALLMAERNTLQAQINDLQARIDDLRDPHLVLVNFAWSDNHPWFSTWYVNIKTTVFNSGYRTATNVKMEVKIYDDGVLIRDAFIDLNEVYPQWYINVDTNVLYYTGDATSIEVNMI